MATFFGAVRMEMIETGIYCLFFKNIKSSIFGNFSWPLRCQGGGDFSDFFLNSHVDTTAAEWLLRKKNLLLKHLKIIDYSSILFGGRGRGRVGCLLCSTNFWGFGEHFQGNYFRFSGDFPKFVKITGDYFHEFCHCLGFFELLSSDICWDS